MSEKKKRELTENNRLCEGVVLSPAFYEKKENRLLTLLIKGFIVYLLSMGSIGFYLSALDVEYNQVLCHLVIGVMAVLCAFLYYRLLIENIGYLILFATFGIMVYRFKAYINSGFYALVNMTVDEASQYFNVDIQRLYTEQIENRYVTVTFVCLFIGVVLDILLNVYISRRMQYVNALMVVMSLNLIPLYLTDEPDVFYVIMIIVGISMAYVFKSGKHYSPQIKTKRDDRVFSKERKKKNISYVYDIKALGQAGIISGIFAICVVLMVCTFKPKDTFNLGYQGNKYKNLTMAAMSTLLMDGLSGFYRGQTDVGGLNSGRLGDVSTVRLDYETDLMVEITPYTYDRIFLKAFTGVEYVPYENVWTGIEDFKSSDTETSPEAGALKDAYENGVTGTAKATMDIKKVDSRLRLFYYPYYTSEIEIDDNAYEIEYYPRLDENETVVTMSDYEDAPYTERDLYVPEENIEAIEELCRSIDWSVSDEEKAEDLQEYFQENIPYTIRPGKTPRKEDFVNYFLTENKKGYCTHYATTAVLVFRYMGIPARYVEGYAIDYNQFEDAILIEDKKYEDYYNGYSELGKTAVLRLNVTDADAHAWVEIYVAGKGFIPVEVTPAGETEEVVDFWEMFDEVMGEDETSAGVSGGNIVNFKIPNKLIRTIGYALAGTVIALILLFMGIKGIKMIKIYIRYIKSGINDKLIIKYSMYCKKVRRKDKKFAEKINYREQVEYLTEKNKQSGNTDKITAILERAGFSDTAIEEKEYEMVVKWLGELK